MRQQRILKPTIDVQKAELTKQKADENATMPDSFERISQDLNAELKMDMMQKSLSYNQNVNLPFKDIKEKMNRSISAVR